MVSEEATNKQLELIKDNLEKTKSFSPTFYNDFLVRYTTAREQFELYSNVDKQIGEIYNDGSIKKDTTRDTYEELVSMNKEIMMDRLCITILELVWVWLKDRMN